MSKLPEKYRTAIREEARKAARWQWGFMAERNADALKEMQEKYGVKVSNVDISIFQAKGLPIQDMVAKKLELTDLLADIRAAK